MPSRDREADRQHMLLVVEAAQRAGYSEREIEKLVEAALNEDDELERAA